MNKQDANPLPAARRHSAGREYDDEALEQMTRLNNEMVAIQRQLARQNAELARINARKDAILGFVAHDLRQPLGVVLGFAEVMLRRPDQLCARNVRFLELIASTTKFMGDMVADLLDISAIEAGQLNLERRPVELVELVARALTCSKLSADAKSIKVTLARCEQPIWVEGDARRLEQMMNNLLSNAIKYSHSSTSVEVALELDADPDHVTVEVRDRGQGIPAAELEHLFQAFHTTSVKPTDDEKSTGLGLAIVEQIVEAHEGRIWVESAVGIGTSFFVQLPRCDAPT